MITPMKNFDWDIYMYIATTTILVTIRYRVTLAFQHQP